MTAAEQTAAAAVERLADQAWHTAGSPEGQERVREDHALILAARTLQAVEVNVTAVEVLARHAWQAALGGCPSPCGWQSAERADEQEKHAAHVAQALAAAGVLTTGADEGLRDQGVLVSCPGPAGPCIVVGDHEHRVETGDPLGLDLARFHRRQIAVLRERVAAVEAVLAEHWDWKAGRSLHAAVTAALATTERDGEGT